MAENYNEQSFSISSSDGNSGNDSAWTRNGISDNGSDGNSTTTRQPRDPKHIVQCSICKKSMIKRTLKGHTRKFHPESAVDSVHHTVCPLCDVPLINISQLQHHITSTHEDVVLQHSEHKFNSENDFHLWKLDIEQGTQSQFVKHRGSQKSGVSEVQYYFCHRSGKSNLKKERKRRVKVGGSEKIEKTCPSLMKVTKSPNNVIVQYQSLHVGHQLESERTVLSKDQRDYLSSQLLKGIPKSVVLQKMSNSRNLEKRWKILSEELHGCLTLVHESISSEKLDIIADCLKTMKNKLRCVTKENLPKLATSSTVASSSKTDPQKRFLAKK